jgi:hypothetical protein
MCGRPRSPASQSPHHHGNHQSTWYGTCMTLRIDTGTFPEDWPCRSPEYPRLETTPWARMYFRFEAIHNSPNNHPPGLKANVSASPRTKCERSLIIPHPNPGAEHAPCRNRKRNPRASETGGQTPWVFGTPVPLRTPGRCKFLRQREMGMREKLNCGDRFAACLCIEYKLVSSRKMKSNANVRPRTINASLSHCPLPKQRDETKRTNSAKCPSLRRGKHLRNRAMCRIHSFVFVFGFVTSKERSNERLGVRCRSSTDGQIQRKCK